MEFTSSRDLIGTISFANKSLTQFVTELQRVEKKIARSNWHLHSRTFHIHSLDLSNGMSRDTFDFFCRLSPSHISSVIPTQCLVFSFLETPRCSRRGLPRCLEFRSDCP